MRLLSARRLDRYPSLALVAALLTLAGCGGAGAPRQAGVTPTPTATPSPAPAPTPTASALDVLPCINQTLPIDRVPPGTRTIDLVVPDTLTIWPDRPLGFPNGRLLSDPVIDLTFGAILIDVNRPGQNIASFAALPLNPPNATQPPLPDFPFANTPNDNAVLDPGTGTNFTFDTAPMSAYVQVDRMGMPAVSTALILSARKNSYNDANVRADTANTFAFDLIDGLTHFAEPLQDDIRALGLVSCAVVR